MNQKREYKFIKGIINGRNTRKRISLVSDSDMYCKNEVNKNEQEEEKKVSTVSSSTLPSYKTIYGEVMIRIPAHKLYGEKAVLKGINKRPGIKLRSGNTLIRKQINRRIKKVRIKNRELVGRQVETQYTRRIWDRRNREIRKKYRKYRKREEKPGRKGEDTEGLIDAVTRYLIMRECEVYRNGYEVRNRIQSTRNGKLLKKWQREEKYRRGDRKGQKTWRDINVLEVLINDERITRERRYNKLYKEFEDGFHNKYEERKKRLKERPERIKVGQVKELRSRSERTKEKPLSMVEMGLEMGQPELSSYREKIIESNQKNSGRIYGLSDYRIEDQFVNLQMEIPTTQYFSKRKNVIRILVRESQKRDNNGRPNEEDAEVKKIRKLPEEERVKIYPERSHLDMWGNTLIQRVENDNRKKVMNNQSVDLSYAKYRDLGRSVMFIYARKRGQRYKRVK